VNIDNVKNQSLLLERNTKISVDVKTQHDEKFGEIMKTNKAKESSKEKVISEMVDNIDNVKVLLEHDLTVENLKKYKEAVRSFLDYFTKNEMQKETFFVRDSRTFIDKKVSIIKAVDEKINNLTENMLETNRGHLETLHQIGEIKGLILDLFL